MTRRVEGEIIGAVPRVNCKGKHDDASFHRSQKAIRNCREISGRDLDRWVFDPGSFLQDRVNLPGRSGRYTTLRNAGKYGKENKP